MSFSTAIANNSNQPNFTRLEAAPGSLDVKWIHGSVSAKHNSDPDIQVHAYNEHTFILRQNMAVHVEAPFMFLIFGRDRAILLDTGATRSPLFLAAPNGRSANHTVAGQIIHVIAMPSRSPIPTCTATTLKPTLNLPIAPTPLSSAKA